MSAMATEADFEREKWWKLNERFQRCELLNARRRVCALGLRCNWCCSNLCVNRTVLSLNWWRWGRRALTGACTAASRQLLSCAGARGAKLKTTMQCLGRGAREGSKEINVGSNARQTRRVQRRVEGSSGGQVGDAVRHSTGLVSGELGSVSFARPWV